VGDNTNLTATDDTAQGTLGTWRLGLLAGWSPSTQWMSEDFRVLPTPAEYRLDLYLLTLLAGVDLPSGTGLGVVLPWGDIRRVDRDADTQEVVTLQTQSLGDLEVRLRQDTARVLPWPLGLPKLVVSAGLVAPTGPFIAKTGSYQQGSTVPASDPTRFASLGRGVWWLLAEAEIHGAITSSSGWYTGLYTRTALHNASNGFDWGPERRTSVGGWWQFWPKHLSATMALDWQWRGLSTELLYSPLQDRIVRQQFLSGGGHWVDLVPSVRATLPAGLSTSVSARLPLYRWIEGTQGVSDYGFFVQLQYSGPLGSTVTKPDVRGTTLRQLPGSPPAGPLVASVLVPGRVTVVDYRADWCAPCKKLAPLLEEWVKTQSGVVLVQVDATDWDPATMERYLPAEPGLPVVDVWGPNGLLVQRVVGPDCFALEALLPPGLAGSATATDSD
jgi:thiol-disulfide isomerase/thioredoxin